MRMSLKQRPGAGGGGGGDPNQEVARLRSILAEVPVHRARQTGCSLLACRRPFLMAYEACYSLVIV